MSKEHITLQSSCVLPSFHLTLEITKGSHHPLWRHLTLIHWHITLIHTLYFLKYVFPFFNFFTFKIWTLQKPNYHCYIKTQYNCSSLFLGSITPVLQFKGKVLPCSHLHFRVLCAFVSVVFIFFFTSDQTLTTFSGRFWVFASIRYLYIFVWFLNFISTIPCVESMTKNHHVVDGIGRGGLCLRKHNIKEPTECYKCVIVIFIW